MDSSLHKRTRAQESRAAIERLYIAMRHLFIRGGYKPLGMSGEALIEAMLTLQPEIYGSITDPERVELEGLLYIFQRLPQGIEEVRFIRLITREGYENSGFTPLVPPKRRRNCYRIDEEQMFIEMTRGRSDIYDVLTHLTFLYVEAEKIRKNSADHRGRMSRDWEMLESIVQKEAAGEAFDRQVAYSYLSTVLGRTFDETVQACEEFEDAEQVNSLFHITYWMGRLSLKEHNDKHDREITFSSALREKIGHHIYGEAWAQTIKFELAHRNLLQRPLHIISSNLHSVMNCLYGMNALKLKPSEQTLDTMALDLSMAKNKTMRQRVRDYARRHGMVEIDDFSGTNIPVQIIDLSKVPAQNLPPELQWDAEYVEQEKPVLVVMDYAFGEQAYETMDELLKPFESNGQRIPLQVKSISIMGKAGILEGKKGDIMIPCAHVFEGTADNYPIKNDFCKADFQGNGLNVYEGTMITVLGTSLQNKDILRYFLKSSWRAVGLEMEGAHYQKAIQASANIRNNISPDVTLRYAYYASDNPLISGQTLASGSLGEDGVKPTYLITSKILNSITTS